MGVYLKAIVEHLESRYGDRIKAYLLACGQTDEWMDYSRGTAGRAKTAAWRAWLNEHGRPEDKHYLSRPTLNEASGSRVRNGPFLA